MTNHISIDTWRFGEHETFYVLERPPVFAADYPIPADVRELVDAADSSWVDLDLELAEWTDTHDALGKHPHIAAREAEVCAWERFVSQAGVTNMATRAALSAVIAWRSDSRKAIAEYELARLDEWVAAESALALARVTAGAALHNVGRSSGVLDSWTQVQYMHDERPRTPISGDTRHNERVRAYWSNIAAGLPEDTLLPGDSVGAGFDRNRR